MWFDLASRAGEPALAAPTCCTAYEEKTLGRLQTLCDDGTRAISTYNKTLERWDTRVMPPPRNNRLADTPREKR
jgi:hypothetical protein